MTYAEMIKRQILNKEKEDKRKHMYDIQLQFIKDSIKEGRDYVVWIYNDLGYYHNTVQKTWANELKEDARRDFESKGFKVRGCVITW